MTDKKKKARPFRSTVFKIFSIIIVIVLPINIIALIFAQMISVQSHQILTTEIQSALDMSAANLRDDCVRMEKRLTYLSFSNDEFAAHIVMIIMSALALLPFLLLIIASFTEEEVALTDGYSYFPRALSLGAYEYILQNANTFVRGYGMTIVVTAIGLVLCIIVTSLTAYVLSKRGLPGVKFMNLLLIFTMLFNGGLVATYINYVTVFHIKNTIWALIVPNLMMNAFNVMLVRNYFTQNIPEEIYESARIDGANEMTIFLRLVMPLSVPILATVGLMSGIAYWNDWQNALYYVDDKALYTIQAILNSINESITALASITGTAGVTVAELPSQTIRMAVAVVAILPILLIYPFFQKYFAAGLMAGSVKG